MWTKAIMFALCCMLSLPSFAQLRVINYQGEIRNSNGTVLSDGEYTITVRIYDVAKGGNPYFTETHRTEVRGGIFSLGIGSIIPLPSTLPFERQLFLGMSVDNGSELEPRTSIGSVPSSIYAGTAGTALSVSPDA